MNDELFALGKTVLQQQAFSQMLGAELTRLVPGHAQMQVTLSKCHQQQHGFVHGGVISYLADNALTFAGGSVLGDCVTSEYKINYVRPAIDSTTLIAEASVIATGKTQAVCRCDVYMTQNGQRKLCAAAQGTVRKVDPPAP